MVCVCVYVGVSWVHVCLCGSNRRWEKLLLNRADIDTALTWMKIFSMFREHERNTARRLTWLTQTNTRHQHSIKQSFHTLRLPKTAAKGRRHAVMWQDYRSNFVTMNKTILKFDAFIELKHCRTNISAVHCYWIKIPGIGRIPGVRRQNFNGGAGV